MLFNALSHCTFIGVSFFEIIGIVREVKQQVLVPYTNLIFFFLYCFVLGVVGCFVLFTAYVCSV